MIDLGIGRIQEYQATVPGVQSAERVRGDKSKEQGQEQKVFSTGDSPAGKTESAGGKEVVPVSREVLTEKIKQLNDLLGGKRNLQFRVNDETSSIRIEVVDSESGEVIRTVPPSELGRVADRIRSGSLFFDDSV